MKKTSLLLIILAVIFQFSSAYAGSDSPETVSNDPDITCVEPETATEGHVADNATAEITNSSGLMSDRSQDILAGVSPIQAASAVKSVEVSYPINMQLNAGYSEPQLRTKPAYMQSYNQNARKNRNSVKKNIFIITAVNAIIVTGVGSILMKSDNNNYKIGGAGI